MTRRTFAVEVIRYFDFPPERVFDAWLDPDRIRAWSEMALDENGLPADVRRVEVDARIGGRFTFSDMRPEGEAVHWGTYLAIDRPRKLVFTWFTSEEEEMENNSTVTVTFESAGTGCTVTLVHEMDPKWAQYEKQVEKGWGAMLDMQARLLVEEDKPFGGYS
ncbi:SRPBCC family protein [Nitratireductor luteus]|uniref:SRPBCC family protein n=1 Tax=Nitratireductor luteus TaxID=2976980 RepID=UPI00223F8740|nr:SRPBCC domain-containing protein [Nitratireductor luteus]